ncbi:MAG: PAS domain S-box protein [Acidimicrobiia bacterium]|nr:PAS domain S-box protein [Acidimicrobiia bacterium]
MGSSAEFRVVRDDGEVRWVRSHSAPIVDEEGTRLGTVGTAIDITASHEAEARRREHEEFTQAILETAAEGIVTCAADGEILAFNAAAEQIFGWDSDEAIGMHISRLLPDSVRDLFMGYLATFRETGRTTLSGEPPRELPGLRKDGSTIPIELAVTEVHWGGRTAFTGVVRDISERKEFERELEHQATHDPLTALPNRALLAAQLESALARAYRNERSVAVLFISLDRMKMVTDSLRSPCWRRAPCGRGTPAPGFGPSDRHGHPVRRERVRDPRRGPQRHQRRRGPRAAGHRGDGRPLRPHDRRGVHRRERRDRSPCSDGLGTAESLISDARRGDVPRPRSAARPTSRSSTPRCGPGVNSRRKTENAAPPRART